MKLKFVAATGFIVVTVLVGAYADETNDLPAFRVEKDLIELGQVKAGQEAVATFVFHNDGEEDVKILRAKPS